MNKQGDRVGRYGQRWGWRRIHPGARVRWLGRWFRLESGTLTMEEFAARIESARLLRGSITRDDGSPAYDGRMDGKWGLFYTYGEHHERSRDHIWLHSIDGEGHPGLTFVFDYQVWDTFSMEV